MKKSILIVLFSSFLLYWGEAVLMAECTADEIIQMHEKGLSNELIESVCSRGDSADYAQEGQRCVTRYGVCSLSVPAAVDTPCFCTNKYTGHSDRGKVQK